MSHEDYMRLALEEAERAAEKGEVPVGAVGVYQDQVIASAYNLREQDQNPLSHAEMDVIDKAARHLKTWRLEGLTFYATLEPCIMCMGALLQARVPKLIFGAMDPKAGACGSLYDLSNDTRLNHRIEVTSGVLADQSQEILQQFFKQLRN